MKIQYWIQQKVMGYQHYATVAGGEHDDFDSAFKALKEMRDELRWTDLRIVEVDIFPGGHHEGRVVYSDSSEGRT